MYPTPGYSVNTRSSSSDVSLTGAVFLDARLTRSSYAEYGYGATLPRIRTLKGLSKCIARPG